MPIAMVSGSAAAGVPMLPVYGWGSPSHPLGGWDHLPPCVNVRVAGHPITPIQ
jgi:hypothetical protein